MAHEDGLCGEGIWGGGGIPGLVGSILERLGSYVWKQNLNQDRVSQGGVDWEAA
jgi:hypothetical protein